MGNDYGTNVGQMYNGEIFTNAAVNIGHGVLNVKDGWNIGRVDYPGPDSGGPSSLTGDCAATIAQMPWIVGGQTLTPDDGTHQPPLGQTGPHGRVTSAGWAAPRQDWMMPAPSRAIVEAQSWCWVDINGVITPPPGVESTRAAAQADLNRALVVAQSAARILAAN